EPEPEPARAAHMPEIIPNEFGVPEDDDWLIGDDTAKEDALAEVDAEADVEVIPDPVTPAVEPQLDTEPQAETEPQVDATEQAEVPGQDSEEEFSFDDFELPEFNEEDALAEADAEAEADVEADVEVIPEPIAPAVDSQLDAEPQAETAPQVDATEQAEVPGQDSEDEFSFDDFELPEFGEEDALAEVVSEPDEAQLEQDLAPEAEKFEFDDLDLPEYDEESAKADSVLDDIEQSSAEPVAEEEGVEFDELDLPEYGEDEAISDAFAEKPTPLTSFSPQGEEQDALHDLFSNPQSFSHADDFSDTEGFSDEAGFSDAEEPELAAFAQPDDSPSSSSGLNSTPLESNSAPTAVQDEPLEGFDDFDETALAELLSEDVQDSVDNMFEKPLDATSIDSAGLDIDAMLEVGGEDWKGFNLAPEQQSSMHNGVPDDQQEIWASAEKQAEPKIKEENWGQQDNLTESGNSRDKQYMTIDELMAQVEQEGEEAINPDDEELKLDVGLNEFPDVIGDIGNYDVDNNAEAAGKLDLAKIYIEMSDSQGAIKLLEEAIVDGSDDIRREAKNLIDTLNGR
ncbi:FimV/HubP family polar landmark protein, partial [Vibrio splendidus]